MESSGAAAARTVGSPAIAVASAVPVGLAGEAAMTVTFLSLVFWTVVVGPLGAILAVPLTLFAKALLIDSSPQTRWMESFLIPEVESKKRSAEKYYDEESPSADTFVDFTAQNSEGRKRIRRTLHSVSLRKLRARTEQK